MMKNRIALWVGVLCLALAAGCTDPGGDAAPERKPAVAPEASVSAAEPPPKGNSGWAGRFVLGVEGIYAVPEKSWLAADDPGDANKRVELVEMMDLYGTLVLVWRYGPEDTGKTLIDGILPRTGESFFQLELEGVPHSAEITGELPENYRVNLGDRAVYLASPDPKTETVYKLPEAVAAQMRAPAGTGAPYDHVRGRDMVAWAGADGVSVAADDGSGAQLVLPNSALPGVVAGGQADPLTGGTKPFELPEYGAGQLCFTAPQFLNGGRQLAATIWLDGQAPGGTGAFPSRCLGVSFVDLATGDISHLPAQQEPGIPPARRWGGGSLFMPGLPFSVMDSARGVRLYGGDLLDTGYEGDGASHTWDLENHIRVREAENGEGKKRLELYRYRLSAPDDGTVLLTAARDSLHIRRVSESHILCEVGDLGGGNSELLLVPYIRG